MNLPQPYKICPRCQQTAELNETICSKCGRPYRTTFEQPTQVISAQQNAPPGISNQQSSTPTSDNVLGTIKYQLPICVLASSVGIIGVFQPLINAPIVGSVNLMSGIEGSLFLGLCILAIVFALVRAFVGVTVLGIAALALIGIRIYQCQIGLEAMKTDGKYDFSILIQWQYGWILLAIAGIGLLIGGAYDILVMKYVEVNSSRASSTFGTVHFYESSLKQKQVRQMVVCVSIFIAGIACFGVYSYHQRHKIPVNPTSEIENAIQNYGKVVVLGMTSDEVLEKIGHPKTSETTGVITLWGYEGTQMDSLNLDFRNNSVVSIRSVQNNRILRFETSTDGFGENSQGRQ